MDKVVKQYLNIYEEVRQDIIEGRFEIGAKLPSKRVMAERQGVSVITVQHAYELLADEGYIQAREKYGYYVVFDAGSMYAGPMGKQVLNNDIVLEDEKDQALEQELDERSFSPYIYAKTTRRVLSEMGDRVMSKSPMEGVARLRRAIASYLNRSRRMNVGADQIIVGAGAEYLYGLVVQYFGRNDIYGIESPSYQKIAKVYSAGGARLEMLKLGNDGIESDVLWNSNAKVLHITPYRSFPSGVTASATKKHEYLKWSIEKDAYIVEDDFESEFTPSRKPEESLFSMDYNGRVIYVNTFTKTISPAIRVAYMVIPTNMIQGFKESVGFYECPVPALEQNIIASLIESGDFERHINRVRRYNRNMNNH